MTAPESARSAYLAAEAEVDKLLAQYALEPTREVFEAAIRAQRARNAARERAQRTEVSS